VKILLLPGWIDWQSENLSYTGSFSPLLKGRIMAPSLDKDNPYAAPGANLNPDSSQDAVNFNPDGKAVGADRAMGWFGRGFDMFKSNPGIWIVSIIVYFVLVMILAMIPLVNMGLSIITPVFFGGFMLGCAAIARGEELRIDHLFEGFQKHFGSLVIVGLITLGAWFVLAMMIGIVAVIALGLGGLGAMMSGGDSGQLASAMMAGGLVMVLFFLVGVALGIPIAMAGWFAPALVVFHNMSPIDAMKASFFGCLKNIVPFLIYGLLWLVFAVLASIPFLLGWLVLVPVVIASVYASYEDIYLN
jgi:hypothetical protein